MDRKQYWNEAYVKYWAEKTKEANSSQESKLNKEDCKTASDGTAISFFELVPFLRGEKILDFGCGFCRFYEYFRKKDLEYFGIDISEAMIAEAQKRYPELEGQLAVSEGEQLPFKDEMFDALICFGVFDACYQEQALTEMLRVVRRGGHILLTGKNTNYHADDQKALVAERNARAKGHYNYFTNVDKMINWLKSNGIHVSKEFYFVRRGDFQEKKCVLERPELFYEYVLVLRKDENVVGNPPDFADAFSRTYRTMHGAETVL